MENNQNLLTFGELYQTYKERFLRLAISYVKEESIAEDFVTKVYNIIYIKSISFNLLSK